MELPDSLSGLAIGLAVFEMAVELASFAECTCLDNEVMQDYLQVKLR